MLGLATSEKRAELRRCAGNFFEKLCRAWMSLLICLNTLIHNKRTTRCSVGWKPLNCVRIFAMMHFFKCNMITIDFWLKLVWKNIRFVNQRLRSAVFMCVSHVTVAIFRQLLRLYGCLMWRMSATHCCTPIWPVLGIFSLTGVKLFILEASHMVRGDVSKSAHFHVILWLIDWLSEWTLPVFRFYFL